MIQQYKTTPLHVLLHYEIAKLTLYFLYRQFDLPKCQPTNQGICFCFLTESKALISFPFSFNITNFFDYYLKHFTHLNKQTCLRPKSAPFTSLSPFFQFSFFNFSHTPSLQRSVILKQIISHLDYESYSHNLGHHIALFLKQKKNR